MILLDTNVVSEVIKPNPDPAVARWLARQPQAEPFVPAVTEAELRFGVAILPEGRRRDALAKAIEGILTQTFAGRVLPFDSPAAPNSAHS
jgi:predicted nucleic acid-binding protein